MLDIINAGSRDFNFRLPEPMQYFADGGPVVGGSSAAPAAGRLDGSLTVNLAEGLVLEHLQTPEAQRVLVRMVAQNRRAMRQALGG